MTVTGEGHATRIAHDLEEPVREANTLLQAARLMQRRRGGQGGGLRLTRPSAKSSEPTSPQRSYPAGTCATAGSRQ